MVNKLVNGIGKKKKKPKVSPAPLMDMPATGVIRSSRKINGMDEDRHYRAKNALDDIQRAASHQRDKGLMRDVRKVARDQVNDINRVLGGGYKR